MFGISLIEGLVFFLVVAFLIFLTPVRRLPRLAYAYKSRGLRTRVHPGMPDIRIFIVAAAVVLGAIVILWIASTAN